MPVLFVDTPLGRFGLEEEQGSITRLLLPSAQPFATREQNSTPLLQEARDQLLAYLAGKQTSFTLPLRPAGTPFMQQVWQALCAIPYGLTASYGQIARAIGRPTAARPVGLANNRNPIPIFIPCHRVIGANGALVGYGGGLTLKRQLLALERGQLPGSEEYA